MADRPPAPGQLAVVQAFVNTLDVETGQDDLCDAGALCAWLAERELIEPDAALGPADLRRAVQLREALRDLLAAHHRPQGAPPARAGASLNAIAGAAPLRLRLAADGSGTLAPARGGLNGAIARLLAIVYTAMVDGSWQRLKICRADRCRWAFYDASKNRSGAWCAMQVCGNRTKVRSYQQRRRAGGAAPSTSA
ncbi:MAG TPA: CGNR zinc finger domain-containing protein [Dehalococcoidia bacterium]|nr:CGNR zinc finger domain-containing protein [Dehalococcoidia bacterium]